jgi:hypothetical protein
MCLCELKLQIGVGYKRPNRNAYGMENTAREKRGPVLGTSRPAEVGTMRKPNAPAQPIKALLQALKQLPGDPKLLLPRLTPMAESTTDHNKPRAQKQH